MVRADIVEAPIGEWTTTVQSAGLSPRCRAAIERIGVPWQLVSTEDERKAAYRLAQAEDGIVVLPTIPPSDVAVALVDHGLPVLAVPPLARSFEPTGSALILWDGSAAALHALIAAIPILRLASAVTLLEIDDGSLHRPAGDAFGLLARHRIDVDLRHEPAFGDKAGYVILDQITAISPAYIVMGGFGHARWIESIVGGVTRRLLAECPVPLFLKH